MNQLEKAQALLKKLNQEILDAQKRREIAVNVADSLEQRNKSLLESIEQEGSLKQKFVVEQAKKRKAELDADITDLEETDEGLRIDLEELNIEKLELEEQTDRLSKLKDDLSNEIESANQKLTQADNEMIDKTSEIRDLRGRIADLNKQIGELTQTKVKLTDDLGIMEDEAEAIGDKIIALDADYKAHKDTLDKKLHETQTRLEKASSDLLKVYGEDKLIRENWAEEHKKLEKRTDTVRKMEARVASAESRVQELEDYMKL